jgi:hypothetical protein
MKRIMLALSPSSVMDVYITGRLQRSQPLGGARGEAATASAYDRNVISVAAWRYLLRSPRSDLAWRAQIPSAPVRTTSPVSNQRARISSSTGTIARATTEGSRGLVSTTIRNGKAPEEARTSQGPVSLTTSPETVLPTRLSARTPITMAAAQRRRVILSQLLDWAVLPAAIV